MIKQIVLICSLLFWANCNLAHNDNLESSKRTFSTEDLEQLALVRFKTPVGLARCNLYETHLKEMIALEGIEENRSDLFARAINLLDSNFPHPMVEDLKKCQDIVSGREPKFANRLEVPPLGETTSPTDIEDEKLGKDLEQEKKELRTGLLVQQALIDGVEALVTQKSEELDETIRLAAKDKSLLVKQLDERRLAIKRLQAQLDAKQIEIDSTKRLAQQQELQLDRLRFQLDEFYQNSESTQDKHNKAAELAARDELLAGERDTDDNHAVLNEPHDQELTDLSQQAKVLYETMKDDDKNESRYRCLKYFLLFNHQGKVTTNLVKQIAGLNLNGCSKLSYETTREFRNHLREQVIRKLETDQSSIAPAVRKEVRFCVTNRYDMMGNIFF